MMMTKGREMVVDKFSPVGVLDSGMGGVSVLRELVALLPSENYIYFGDSANAPYGSRTDEEIIKLSEHAIEGLIADGVKALVIGCNTISAHVAILRKKYENLPIIATEPAVKPAAESFPGGNVVVMATVATLRGKKFDRLMERYKDMAHIVKCPCPGLMDFVERGDIHSDALRAYITERLSSLDGVAMDEINAIVLGCTHYPFVRGMIEEVVGNGVKIFDPAPGIARQLLRRLKSANMLNDSDGNGEITWQNSSPDKKMIELEKNLLTMK
ncbi:MAG: glutamate racemase [Selenomonadaceae bacterium]